MFTGETQMYSKLINVQIKLTLKNKKNVTLTLQWTFLLLAIFLI